MVALHSLHISHKRTAQETEVADILLPKVVEAISQGQPVHVIEYTKGNNGGLSDMKALFILISFL